MQALVVARDDLIRPGSHERRDAHSLRAAACARLHDISMAALLHGIRLVHDLGHGNTRACERLGAEKLVSRYACRSGAAAQICSVPLDDLQETRLQTIGRNQ